MFQSFILRLLVEAVKNPDIRAFMFELVDRLGDRLLPKLGSLIPLAAAAAAKRLGDIPDSVGDLTEHIRQGVNEALPEGIDIPFISEAWRNVTGFDLSDVIFGRKPNG